MNTLYEISAFKIWTTCFRSKKSAAEASEKSMRLSTFRITMSGLLLRFVHFFHQQLSGWFEMRIKLSFFIWFPKMSMLVKRCVTIDHFSSKMQKFQVESSKATKQVLKMEVAVLRRLQGPKFLSWKMVTSTIFRQETCLQILRVRSERQIQLSGDEPSGQEPGRSQKRGDFHFWRKARIFKFQAPKQCFSLSTAIRVGVQILEVIFHLFL